jgi:release factor glutamine methyltransferase
MNATRFAANSTASFDSQPKFAAFKESRMTQTQVWTIGKLLEWTTDYLKKSGSDSPRLDAEVLLAHVRSCPRIHLYTAFLEEPDDATKAAFREMVKRRAEGTPVAYLVGQKEFYSLKLRVSPDVLIPRSETEHVVVEALDCIKQLRKTRGQTQPIQVADVCTGSGCIAVAVAKHAPESMLTAIDISPKALEIAKQNIADHNVSDRIAVFESDLFRSVPDQGPFDLILSNPPYVTQDEFDKLPKSVRDFEPKVALVAGPSGLDVINRLLAEGHGRLALNGWLIFEISPMLAASVRDLIEANPNWKLERLVKDLAGHSRVVVARKVA